MKSLGVAIVFLLFTACVEQAVDTRSQKLSILNEWEVDLLAGSSMKIAELDEPPAHVLVRGHDLEVGDDGEWTSSPILRLHGRFEILDRTWSVGDVAVFARQRGNKWTLYAMLNPGPAEKQPVARVTITALGFD